MNKYELGNISESVVLNAYLKAGFLVSVPFGSGTCYDLVVDTGTQFYKIQVKTAWINGGCINYKSQRRQPGKEIRRKYEEDEVDYFAVYSPRTESLYAIAAKNHTSQGRLRLTQPANGQEKLIRWASDYTWERHLEELRN
jgi:hypothetical protein